MIKVIINYKNNSVSNINIKGHANYDEYGKDIVCASVSSIITTTINGIVEINEDAITYKDFDNELNIDVLKEDDIVIKLIDNMINLLEQLEKDYKDNIKIIRR